MRNPQQPPAPSGAVFPLCFKSKADYDGWHKAAWKVHFKNPKPLAYCEDCTIGHQQRMKAEGRCENPTHPLGIFE